MTETVDRDQVVEQAAKYNKLIGAGQSFEAEDQTAIDAYFDPLVAQLRVEQICDVTDEDEIPAEWFTSLAQLLANLSGPEFGIEYNPQKKLVIEVELRRMNSARATYETLRTTYY